MIGKSSQGSAFVIVVLLLAAVFLLAGYFLSSTTQQGHFTDWSVRGLQATCLAESAVDRAIHLIQRELQSPEVLDREKGNANSIAVLLRFPLRVQPAGGAAEGSSDRLGRDEALDVTEFPAREIRYSLTPGTGELGLRLEKTGTNDDLDQLAKFMAGGRLKSYDVKVTVRVDKAFRIGAKTEKTDSWKVPGIDLEWSIRDDVKKFLEGEGFVPFILKFPHGLQVFSFSIPITVKIPYLGRLAKTIYEKFIAQRNSQKAPVFLSERQKLAKGTEDKDEISIGSIDIVGILDGLLGYSLKLIDEQGYFYVLKKIGSTADEGILPRLFSLDFLAGLLINSIAPGKYPVTISFEKYPMPGKSLWPAQPVDMNGPIGKMIADTTPRYLEKYGELKFSSEATIVTEDGHSTTRRVEAVKEFKVADVEPVAPMYSFFVQNEKNERVHFNDVGGQFFVNNLDLTDALSRLNPLGGITTGLLQSLKPGPTEITVPDSASGNVAPGADPGMNDWRLSEQNTVGEIDRFEIPGLIRVNYATDNDEDPPILVNVSMIGEIRPGKIPPIDIDMGYGALSRALLNLGRGIEILLILTSKYDLSPVAGSKTLLVKYSPKKTSKNRNRRSSTGGWIPDNPFGFSLGSATWEGTCVRGTPEDEEKKTAKELAEEEKKAAFDKKHPTDPISKEFILKKLDDRDAVKNPSKFQELMKKGWKILQDAKLNVHPDFSKLSSDPITFGLTMGSSLFKSLIGGTRLEKVSDSLGLEIDCFQKWEMPFMGFECFMRPWPSLGWEMNKTHLFGYGALHPTLTREIEGKVCKQFRQWGLTIVGLNPMDRLPILPPPIIFFPPIPIPVWYNTTVQKKYDYAFFPLKSFDLTKKDDPLVSEVTPYDPGAAENLPPNLYSLEQYAKKANYYYETYQDFQRDLVHRIMVLKDGRRVLLLNGVTFIAGNIGSEGEPFRVQNADPGPGAPAAKGADDVLYASGKGMIVCSGNCFLGCSLKSLDYPDPLHPEKIRRTIFSLIVRSGGLVIRSTADQKSFALEGSLYTDKGIVLPRDTSFHVVGNWVTNQFQKNRMGGTMVIDYVSSRVRNSLGTLHPAWGKFDPQRYHVSLSPIWSSWRAQ